MASKDGGKSLQDLIDDVPSLTDYLYNETIAPHFRARTGLTAQFIPPEFTNWRDEQRAWRETAILFDQSHHMPELFLRGPDARKLLERVAINSLANIGPDRAKQMVCCTPKGHVIGDCILYCHGENDFELVSSMPLQNWVEFQAISGGYNVKIERDDPTPYNPKGRRILYRFQLEGPHAAKIFDEVVEGNTPEIKFFNVARLKIAGCQVTVLRHGMAGHMGAEISGPYEEMDTVRNAILAAGAKYGIKQGGTRSYFSTLSETGWMAYPLPGIYTDPDLRGYREWLPASSWEGNAQLGGSFVSNNIEDYYATPYELGYEKITKFDHDFIGREALEKSDINDHRKRVYLVWHHDDVVRVYASQFGRGPRLKAIELPVVYYGFPHFDEVRDRAGRLVGLSCHTCYSNNEGELVSLAMIDREIAEGTELSVTWGEPNGGSSKPHVEKHEMTDVRATVAPVPYSEAVRKMQRAKI